MWSLKNLGVLIYPKLHETNSCDYLLLHEKIWVAFPLLRVTACPSSRLQMTTSTKIGQYFDGWILMDNNAVGGNLFTENWRLLSFYVSFHCRHGKKYNCDQDYFVLFCFVWVLVEESVATRYSLMAVFVVHASFYSRVREKTKVFLASLISFQELHLMWVWIIITFFCLFWLWLWSRA